MKNKAFTLIELIVVITILSILGTIAFISFKGYSSEARNSKKISDYENISLALNIIKARGDILPVPEGNLSVNYSGNIMSYEGLIGKNTQNKLKISGNLKDNNTGELPLYIVDKDRKKFSVGGFLEEVSSYNTNVNANLDGREIYLVGDDLTTLLDLNGKPVSGELTSLGSDDFNAYFGNKKLTISSGKVQDFPSIGVPARNSCKAHLTAGESKNGLYKIKIGNGEKFVYCNQDKGGWMYLGQYSNQDKTEPNNFFVGYGTPTNNVVDYGKDKLSWSYPIQNLKITGDLEMSIIVGTETTKQGYSPVSKGGLEFTNGIIKTNKIDMLTMSDREIFNKYGTNLGISHRCNIDGNEERILNHLSVGGDGGYGGTYETDNSKMQFSNVNDTGHGNDIWHWNVNNEYYFRPTYNYCEQKNDPIGTGNNPGKLVTTYFWVKY